MAVRVVDLVPEEHFSEGEPDLEAPEELALAELDDETILEEELDNDDVSEEDLDEDVLTATLEHVAHADDEDGDDDGDERTGDHFVGATAGFDGAEREAEMEVLEVLEVDEIEDLEESLDRLLAQRLALDGRRPEEIDEPDELDNGSLGTGTAYCAEEFVCSGCFLVRNRAQLADTAVGLCRDCVS